MTDKITLELTLDELKTLDKHIEYTEETKSVFDKIKDAYPQSKMTLENEGEYAVVSYNDKTYYRLMGELSYFFCWYERMGVSADHPIPTLVMVNDAETERLLEGLYYNHIEVKKETAQEPEEPNTFTPKEIKELVKEGLERCEDHQNENPLDWVKPQTPEQVEQGLKEAFREAVKQGVVSSTTYTALTDLIFNWWEDVFTTNSNDDMEICIDTLVDRIEAWLPKEQSAGGSQNAYVECTVEGFNDCIAGIKNKLR